MCQVWAKKQQRCALTLKCALLSALTTPFQPRLRPLPNAVISLALGRLRLPKASRRIASCCRHRCGAFCVGSTAFSRACANCNAPPLLPHQPAHCGRRRFCCLLYFASCLLPAVCFSLCFDFYFAIAIDKQRPSPCLKVSWFFVFRALWRLPLPCSSNPLSSHLPLEFAFSCSLRFLMLLAGIPKELIAVLNRVWLSRSAAGDARNEKWEARSENWELRSEQSAPSRVLLALKSRCSKR